MRHSAAVPSDIGLPDDHRYLSAAGRSTCRQVGRLLRESGVTFDAIVASPLVRAMQTAELIADAVDYLGVVESHVSLVPGASAVVACKELIGRGASVLAVSHEPTVSSVAAFLVGQPGFAPFRTAQVCYFEARRPVWRLHPEALQLEELHIPS